MHIRKYRRHTARYVEEDQYDIQSRDYPISDEEVATCFADLSGEDILFVHSHGNDKGVIGTGGFTLTPEQLSVNLMAMGLKKNNPPAVVVWACNSGIRQESNNQTYAEELTNHLTANGYSSLNVVGISGKIVISEGKKDPISFVLEYISRDKLRKRTLTDVEATDVHYSTPERGSQANFHKLDGVITVIKKLQATSRGDSVLGESREKSPIARNKWSNSEEDHAVYSPQSDRRSTLRSYHQALQRSDDVAETDLSTPQHLDYGNDKSITDDQVRVIANALINNINTVSLDLSYTSMSDEGACALIRALKNNTTLTHLNISNTNLSPETEQAFVSMMRQNENTTLLKLEIGPTPERSRMTRPR